MGLGKIGAASFIKLIGVQVVYIKYKKLLLFYLCLGFGVIVLSVLRGLERLFFGGFQKIVAEQGKVGIGVFGGRRKPLFFKDFFEKMGSY